MLSFGGSLFMAFPAANSYGIGERNRHLTFNTTVGRLRRRYLPRRTVIPIWSAIPVRLLRLRHAIEPRSFFERRYGPRFDLENRAHPIENRAPIFQARCSTSVRKGSGVKISTT